MELRGIDFGEICLRMPVLNIDELPQVDSNRPFFYSVRTMPYKSRGPHTKQQLGMTGLKEIVKTLRIYAPFETGVSIDCTDLLLDCDLHQLTSRMLGICTVMKGLDRPLMLQVTHTQLMKIDAAELLGDDRPYDAICVTGNSDQQLTHELIILIGQARRIGIPIEKPLVAHVSNLSMREELLAAGVGSIETIVV